MTAQAVLDRSAQGGAPVLPGREQVLGEAALDVQACGGSEHDVLGQPRLRCDEATTQVVQRQLFVQRVGCDVDVVERARVVVATQSP
jgi:hypothetical protein